MGAIMWHFYPGKYMPSYQVNRALTQAHYGGGEFAEIIEVAGKIDPDNRETFNQEWLKKGNQVFEWAEDFEKKNALVSARRTYLRAFNYLRTAEFFMNLQDSRKLETYTKAREAFIRAIKYFDEKPLQIEVPFENSFLPGYLFSPPLGAGGPPPVMVMFGGLDSLAEELYFGIGNHLNERGIALLAVDGPGQGAALRLNHIHSRHDYNVAGTAVYEYVAYVRTEKIEEHGDRAYARVTLRLDERDGGAEFSDLVILHKIDDEWKIDDILSYGTDAKPDSKPESIRRTFNIEEPNKKQKSEMVTPRKPSD